MNLYQLYHELKRRNIFKAILSYLVIGWVVLQVASIILPILNAPEWTLKAVLYVLLIGLPAWLVFAWIYDITLEGIKKTDGETDALTFSRWSNKRLNHVIIGGLLIVVVLLITDRMIRGNFQQPVEFKGVQEKRVAVLPFTNNTGDESLDAVGTMISEWVTRGLMKTGEAIVVQQSNVIPYLNLLSIVPNLNNTKLSFADATGAIKIIRGSYYGEGDSIIIHSELVNAKTGDIEFAFNIQKGHKDNASIIVNRLMSHIGGYWIAESEVSLDKISPPSLEAWREYEKGLRIMGNLVDPKKGFFDSEKHFEKAIKMDSTLYLAWIYLIRVRNYTPRANSIDQLLNQLKSRKEDMTQYETYLLEYREALFNKDNETAFEYSKLIYEMDPNSIMGLELFFSNALKNSRANILINIWESIDTAVYNKNNNATIIRSKMNIYHSIVQAYISVKEFNKALVIIKKPNPFKPTKNIDLGIVYSSINEIDKFNEVLESCSYREAQVIGIYHEINQNEVLSNYCYDKALSKVINGKNYAGKAMIYWHLKEYNKACSSLYQVVVQPSNSNNLTRLWKELWTGICLSKIDNVEAALQLINKTRPQLNKLESEEFNMLNYTLAIFYAEIGDKENTIKCLREIDFGHIKDPIFHRIEIIYPTIFHLLKDNHEFNEMMSIKDW